MRKKLRREIEEEHVAVPPFACRLPALRFFNYISTGPLRMTDEGKVTTHAEFQFTK
jgi:hypothetical protein